MKNLEVKGARQHNLRNISVTIPRDKLTVITGVSGSGKSSLLKIMAGQDDGFTGEARLTPGFTVGYLPQEPQLDESLDVLGNVSKAVGPTKQLLDRFGREGGLRILKSRGAAGVDMQRELRALELGAGNIS